LSPGQKTRVTTNFQMVEGRDNSMKYLTIAVLLAIVAGAIIHYFKHDGKPPPAESSSGWMQR
jgi:hypothetical protein